MIIKWNDRITDKIPFESYEGHKSFLYYKKTVTGKNITLNLAWLRYNAAIQLFSNERIIGFALVKNDKMKTLIRKGQKSIILKEELENDSSNIH